MSTLITKYWIWWPEMWWKIWCTLLNHVGHPIFRRCWIDFTGTIFLPRIYSIV